MQRVRQKNTSAESALRRALDAFGLSYRVDGCVLAKPRLAFSGLRVAGCFWHGCRLHASWPKDNAEFWRAKNVTNQERDRDSDERLRVERWTVIRVWAHEELKVAAGRIARRRERMHRT